MAVAGRPLRIAVISSTHLPSAGADTEVIVNTAAALGAAGAEVTLVVPWLWRRRRLEEICGFYGVNPTFRLARRAAERHQIGTHLYSHDRRSSRSIAAFDEEMRRCVAAHDRVFGVRPAALRFPFGNPGRVRAADLGRWGSNSKLGTGSRQPTVAALPRILKAIARANLTPVTLSDLFSPRAAEHPEMTASSRTGC